MTLPTIPSSKILNLTLTLSNYPILAKGIRERMRQELFVKGIISPDTLEEEVEKKAVASQRAEGLLDPIKQETPEIWQERLDVIRDHLTDFYFAYNLPFSKFQEIVEAAVNENRAGQPRKVFLTFNPELAPWYMLIEQAEKYAAYPPDMFESIKHHLREIIVVLLKGLVSDQLAFVRIARDFIDIFDLKEIKARKIGRGKIGGKAAGMYLAYKILSHPDKEDDDMDLSGRITIPETYYISSDVYYNFKTINNLEYTISQKYRSREEIEREYPRMQQVYQAGRFPEEVVDRLRQILSQVGQAPLIVRSSSLLEDNFGSAFAGKYDSYFLPNQGSLEENLTELLAAVTQIYASVLSPDALFYRQRQGLDDYDERMAILIQKVAGEKWDRYFFPVLAGVGFSQNPYMWTNTLKREEGFLRIVFGLGTRAVDRVDRDYPRMIGLSHPQLRPVSGRADMVKYSQHFMDVIDLADNSVNTIPVSEVLSTNFPGIQFLASIDEGDYVKPIYSLGRAIAPEKMVLTFENLLLNTDFVSLMKTILKKLERHYKRPVDIEFAVELTPGYPQPNLRLILLQCRPLNNSDWNQNVVIPRNIPQSNQIFSSNHLVPQGIVEKIKYIIYVDPIIYSKIPSHHVRLEIARVIGRLNKRLADESFILMGPGRWGSSNLDLGVKVSYADIYNTRMLIEIAISQNGIIPEVSYGTHFFQDLIESRIFPLSLFPDDADTIFNRPFFYDTPNELPALLPADTVYADYIKVINIPKGSSGKYLRVVMSAKESMALGYLAPY